MAEPEELDEDLFADLYEADESAQVQAAPAPQVVSESEPPLVVANEDDDDNLMPDVTNDQESGFHNQEQQNNNTNANGGSVTGWQGANSGPDTDNHHENSGPTPHSGIGIKEDGKMFIGGLNWETTDQSLKDYFSQFGEVQECTVMRDGASGRSRGFGFLTFKDPKTVNIVMVKEHFLDNKIIDPKRAIPRDEQERTSKIFVGGVSQEANEQDFKEYFTQYGRVIDATLMMDKDTGRPRGFGFVTFDSEAAVDATLQGDLTILGKPIEVKKAQPRGNMREEEEQMRRGGGRRGGKDSGFHDQGNQGQNQQGGQAYTSGMTPQMMAQYFQRMQQYFAQMMSAGGMPSQAMGVNPAMMQQMQQMQQIQQMQAMQKMQQQSQQQGSQSPMPQSPGAQGMSNMTPQMMQQMQQMQQMQMQNQIQSQMQNQPQVNGAPTGPQGGRRHTPSHNAQDQIMFEQQKYEQQSRRGGGPANQGFQQGGPTSWEGMYDDVPQPNMGEQNGSGRGRGGRSQSVKQPSAAPANAPTGPKNAGVPGANYRGGRGGHRGGFHPYARRG